jgi:hypothetical protein
MTWFIPNVVRSIRTRVVIGGRFGAGSTVRVSMLYTNSDAASRITPATT